MADQFNSAPGTRARAMGYAFSAFANNTSAAYYNPAGYVQDRKYKMFTLERGTSVVYDETDPQGKYFNKTSQLFGGLGFFSPIGGGGIASYKLYDIYRKYSSTEAIYQDNRVFHIAGGFAINNHLALGIGWGFVSSGSGSGENSSLLSKSKVHNGYTVYELNGDGDFFNFGLLFKVFKTEGGNKMTLSATYRQDAEIGNYGASKKYNKLFVNIPKELVYGASFNFNTSKVAFTLNIDKKSTTYDQKLDFASSDTLAIGLEIAPYNGWSFRFGKYKSTPKNKVYNSYEIDGNTAGFAYKFSNFNIELSVDDRKMLYQNTNDSTKNTYSSISINWVF